MAARKIGFNAGPMTLRGTSIALFDYALHNQTLLGNQSVVFYDAEAPGNQQAVLDKFSHFQLVPYRDFADLNNLAERISLDAIYIIKSGEIDHQIVESVPALIHAVFPQPVSAIHGDVYAFVSEWLSKECSNHKIPFVPHMISLPDAADDLRAQLNIPLYATVFGCYGGSDSFNLAFAQRVIHQVVETSSDTYFLFMNIAPFAKHERIIFLPGNADMTYKVRFINTCDAMIHARGIGESFGLACGEFSIRNKPVITYALSPQRSHIDTLGPKAMQYRGPTELERIFLEFDRTWAAAQDWDCYSAQYSPAPVMAKFNDVFLWDNARRVTEGDITIEDRCIIQYYRALKKLRNLSRKLYL